MGRFDSGLELLVSCLVLAWVAGSGGGQARLRPTCFSDYLSTSTCEWGMGGPTNCSAELRLTYQLDFPDSENRTCVPANKESAACLCDMLMDDVVSADTYQLDLWAGTRRLWSGSFRPSEHVKPRAPGNLTVNATDSHTWQLSWSNPYPPGSFLHTELSYLVSISSEDDPAEVLVRNVTYMEPTLRFPASALRPGASYRARVRAWAPSYSSAWSQWSPSVRWLHDYERPWEQRLPLAVSISCVVIVVVCLSCYLGVIKIKKEWWDHIPNPAHSPLMAIVIHESPVSPWAKRAGGQEPAKCPHWKTCLTKLLPCLLEHGMEKDGAPKAAGSGPVPGPGKPAWRPVEVSRTVLWPESISVVKCVELLEAPVESEEEEPEEEDGGSFCPSPGSSGGSCQESREGIAARLTERLLLDLLGGEAGGFCPPGLGASWLLPSSGSVCAQTPWAELPGEEPQEASRQGWEQPSDPEPPAPAAGTRSPACPAVPALPAVIADNPAYRSFGSLLRQPSAPGELAPDPPLAGCRGDGDPDILSAPQPPEPPAALQPEPETWEQVLRRSVLQHRAAAAPASAPGGYRQFAQAVEQGRSPSGEAGYKAFSSLLASGAVCPGTSGAAASAGEGCDRPFQSPPSGCPGVPGPLPLFTFGLDMGPPHSPQDSLLPSGYPESPLEPAAKGEDGRQRPLSLEQAPDPLSGDLGSGIVYSALTCHLCGHLKQRRGLEERGEAPAVPAPCCGCCCGDGSQPPGSPLPGGVPLKASLPPASLAPSGVSEEGKPCLFSQPGPSDAQSSSPSPGMVAGLSTGPTRLSVS